MAKLPFSPVFPMGFLKVAAAGTPVDLLTAAQTAYASFSGLVAAMKSGAGVWPAKFYKITFAAIGSAVCPGITAGGAGGAGNTGTVYFGLKGMVKATGFSVIIPIPKPAASAVNYYEWVNPDARNQYRLEDFFIDADNTGDGVFVTVHVE